MPVNHKETVNKVNAAFAANELEEFLSQCTDNVVWTIVGDRTVEGKAAIREWMGPMTKEPPKFSVQQLIGDGDFVTGYGDMTMQEDDGTVGDYSYCDVFRFQGDKVAELKSFVIKTDKTDNGK
jgi:uncharacterized protein